jgi:hypothetical protein
LRHRAGHLARALAARLKRPGRRGALPVGNADKRI